MKHQRISSIIEETVGVLVAIGEKLDAVQGGFELGIGAFF
jgi:hypothetical protein